jgi:hypothetical protein
VPELMPPDVAKKAGAKLDQNAPICTVAELPDYDAIIFGTPTRFGNMAAQMRNFLDQEESEKQRTAENGIRTFLNHSHRSQRAARPEARISRKDFRHREEEQTNVTAQAGPPLVSYVGSCAHAPTSGGSMMHALCATASLRSRSATPSIATSAAVATPTPCITGSKLRRMLAMNS